jgi:hypothetical protein
LMKPKGFRGTTALSFVVNAICDAYSIDFAFYDAGPNIGPLNRVILLDSDFFIVPAACDLFSVRALKTLGATLAHWITSWRTVTQIAPTEDTYLLPGFPRFLGYIPQRFKIYGGLMASDYARYMPLIEKQIGSDVVAVLRRISPALVPMNTDNYQLGQIKDFSSLATASQVQGQPMHRSNAGTPAQREEAAEQFNAIALQIVRRTQETQ